MSCTRDPRRASSQRSSEPPICCSPGRRCRAFAFGATPVASRAADRPDGGREHEVVAVLRPEEMELAPTRDRLRTNYIANGVVEEIVFTGALERMRLRMANGAADAHLPAGTDSRRWRTARGHAHATRATRVSDNAGSIRRHRCATHTRTANAACRVTRPVRPSLRQWSGCLSSPFLSELAARMKTRIAKRVEPALAGPATSAATKPISGVAVIGAQSNATAQIEWLVRNGAAEVWCCPRRRHSRNAC